MDTIIGADTVKLAGLQIDQLQKVRKGHITLEHLEWFNNLSKEQRDVVSNTGLTKDSFKIWKTIKLSTGLKTAKDFRKVLKKNGNRIGGWGDDILGQSAFTVSDTEKDVDLVKVSVAELGFKDGATRKDIYDRALELGLQLCPAEVGPQLRLQYADQPKGEWLRIAMEPITGSGGDPHVFYVAHDSDGRWLHGSYGPPNLFWNGDYRFVFLRSKSSYFSPDYLLGEFCFVQSWTSHVQPASNLIK